MVFAILPNRKADTYAAIKKLCCLDYEHKMPSQCVLYSTIRDREKITAVASKVRHFYESCEMSNIIRLSCKWIVNWEEFHGWSSNMLRKLSLLVSTLTTIQVKFIDSSATPPIKLISDRKGKNITGVVSSLNQNCDQWFSQIVMQSSKELYKFIFRLNSAYFHFSTRNATDTFRNRFL